MIRKLIALLISIVLMISGLSEAPEPVREKLAVEQLMEAMTVREKLLQLFIVTPEALTGEGTVTGGDKLAEALASTPVGGIVMFSKNLVNSDQTRSMISKAQSAAKYGLFVAVDEEGGAVGRLMHSLGTTRLGPMYSYRAEGPERARENASVIGSDLSSHGFNLDFAPVADVWSNPENRVIGTRAYSNDPQEAAELVAAAVKGFHSAGVACTLKHFPGHGDTVADSHTGEARVELGYDELARLQFPPFEAGIDAGADMVMVGHLTVPALDTVPATVSKAIVTDLLRGELGFDGVVITDALNMSAVAKLYDPGTLAVKAIGAGVDILLMPEDLSGSISALESALERGELTQERIDESVRRILTLKIRYGITDAYIGAPER